MNPRDRELAQLIWNYHRLNHSLEKADAILVLCSHDEAVAKWAAKLFLDQWAPLVIFSGGSGTVTRTLWNEAEADRFARLAIAEGVPANSILVENRSTNTGENIAFTRALLAERRI